MSHLELALIATFAVASAGCMATINAFPSAGDEQGNVEMELETDDGGVPWPEAPGASKPQTAAHPMAAGSVPPMAAMPAAGGRSPPPADAGAVCDFRALVQAKCGNASCHGAPASSTGLDLTSASLAMRVAGRKGPNACASKLLIDPANPAESALYFKVTGTTCGAQMPLGGSLTPGEQACVLSWIEALQGPSDPRANA
jgi:hypothetical protein